MTIKQQPVAIFEEKDSGATVYVYANALRGYYFARWFKSYPSRKNRSIRRYTNFFVDKDFGYLIRLLGKAEEWMKYRRDGYGPLAPFTEAPNSHHEVFNFYKDDLNSGVLVQMKKEDKRKARVERYNDAVERGLVKKPMVRHLWRNWDEGNF